MCGLCGGVVKNSLSSSSPLYAFSGLGILKRALSPSSSFWALVLRGLGGGVVNRAPSAPSASSPFRAFALSLVSNNLPLSVPYCASTKGFTYRGVVG